MKHWRFIRRYGRRFNFYAQIQWEPGTWWVGVLCSRHRYSGMASGRDARGDFIDQPWTQHVMVCVVPMLPLHVTIFRVVRP